MASWTAPALPAPLSVPTHPAFVGRRSELETLEEVWAAVTGGRRQVVFVGGEPGAGKSRLVAEVAAALRRLDAVVLLGMSFADFGVPYQPFVQAIDHLLTGTAQGALSHLLDGSARELLRLTPHVRRHRPDLEEPTPSEREYRRELFDAVVALLRGVASERPVVLVLEDLHWAGVPTLQLLTHMVQSTAEGRILILGTQRTNAPDRSDELTYAIADLYRLDGVRRIDLAGLAMDDIAEYLVRDGGVSASTARGSAAVLRDQTGGNPFFLREFWRDLAAHGGIDALRASGFKAPESVRDALGRRLSSLSDAESQVVELAAVMGDSFEVATLLAASEHDGATTLSAIDNAVRFGLVEVDTDAPGRYSFLHALARQAVLDRTPPSTRARMHARAAEAIEGQALDAPDVVVRLAHHYMEACALGYGDQARRYLVEAAQHAKRSLAYEEAASWYEQAANLSVAGSPSRSELLSSAAASHLRAGDFAQARELYEELAKSDDPSMLMRAAIGYEDASWRPGLAGRRAVELLSEAIRRYRPDLTDPTYVRALASFGRALAFTGAVDEARQLGSRAIEFARALDDDRLLAHALQASLWHLLTPDLASIQFDRALEVSRLADAIGDRDYLGPAAYFRSTVAYMRGHPEDWAAAHDDLDRSARLTGQPFFRYVTGCCEYARQFIRGDLAGAERTAEALVELGSTFGSHDTEGPYGVQIFMIRRAAGALEQVRPLISGDESGGNHWTPGLLALCTELGLREPATRLLAELLDVVSELHSNTAQWPAVMAFMIEAAVALEDVAAARRLRPFVAEYAGLNLVAGQFVAVFGSADRYLGALDSLLGAHAADEHFEAALAMDARMGSVIHEAETLAAHAAHLQRRGGPEARERAARLRIRARRLAERHGHQRVLRMLAADSPFAPAVAALPDGLSPREIEVLKLLAEGLSNREIGERLFISQHTAANHVRSILTKTSMANRTQAAVYAKGRGLIG